MFGRRRPAAWLRAVVRWSSSHVAQNVVEKIVQRDAVGLEPGQSAQSAGIHSSLHAAQVLR